MCEACTENSLANQMLPNKVRQILNFKVDFIKILNHFLKNFEILLLCPVSRLFFNDSLKEIKLAAHGVDKIFI